jgi:hypothetical protein
MTGVTALPRMSEKEWGGQFEDLLGLGGWRYYHTWRSLHSVAGFPDYVCLRPPEIMVVELKTDAARSKLTAAQVEWLALFEACGIETHVWRPSDFDAAFARVMRGRAASRG